jgi:pilus assembly protein CpaB
VTEHLALRSSDRADAAVASAQDRETTIVVAARDLLPGSIIKAEALTTKQIKIGLAPEGFIADPVWVVGKVLNAAVVKDQPLLASVFASEGSALHLAAALPPGMRAVPVSLAGSAGLRGLLLPGCNVDVLSTSKPQRGKPPRTKVLLERVLVLGIEDQTIVSSDEAKESANRYSRRGQMVLLLLDVEQATTLQSAVQAGTISLVLRHPLDDQATEIEAQIEEPLVPQKKPELEPAEEEYVTEEINGGSREKVIYVKQGEKWQRKDD